MILKESVLNVSDNCGIHLVKCFHIYQNKKKKWGQIGKFVKVSYRHMDKKLLKLKGKKSRAIFFRSKYKFKKPDGTNIKFCENACVLLKRRVYPRGKISAGIVVYNIKRKKFTLSFHGVL